MRLRDKGTEWTRFLTFLRLPDRAAYTPYGGARDLFYAREHEVILSGPAETGKTLAACWKAHLLACKYAGCNGAIVRKTQASVYGSVLQTFQRVIKGAPVDPYGGERPEKYIYANGSIIWIGGMDNPDKILSSERDFVYVNQAEELLVDDWEKLATRTTGRGAVVRYPQLFGDCNPGGSRHWIRARAQVGTLRLLISGHKENPAILQDAGRGLCGGCPRRRSRTVLRGCRPHLRAAEPFRDTVPSQ